MAFKPRMTKSQFMQNKGWAASPSPEARFNWVKINALGHQVAERFPTWGTGPEGDEWKADSLDWEAFCQAHPEQVI